VLLETGMPGSPGAAGVSVLGSTSCVHVLPPAVFGTNWRSGSSTFSFIPSVLLSITVVRDSGSALGRTLPPHALVAFEASSRSLAISEAGPSAASRWPPTRYFFPLLTLIRRTMRR
jgi:hypothetical protein